MRVASTPPMLDRFTRPANEGCAQSTRHVNPPGHPFITCGKGLVLKAGHSNDLCSQENIDPVFQAEFNPPPSPRPEAGVARYGGVCYILMSDLLSNPSPIIDEPQIRGHHHNIFSAALVGGGCPPVDRPVCESFALLQFAKPSSHPITPSASSKGFSSQRLFVMCPQCETSSGSLTGTTVSWT